jgi:hypothetical protein
MTIDKEIKNKIIEEWHFFIPQLVVYAQNKLYKIVGCFVLGIEAVNIPNIEGYKPHFVVYPLWKDDLKRCLDVPYLYICLENKKGLQFSIPYLKHNDYFNEAVECFKNQIPISLNDNITLKSLFELADSRFSDVLIKSNSAQQAKIFELEFYAALYTGNQNQVQNVLSQVQIQSKGWDMQMFEMWYGKLDLWLQRLQENLSNREGFFKQIEINKQDKKISELKSSELTA